MQLVLNGLIEFSIVRYGKTYLRQLTNIRTEFIVVDTCEKIIESKTEGMQEFEGDTQTLEFDLEPVMSIGLSQDKINQLKNNSVSQLVEPEPIVVELSSKSSQHKTKSNKRMWTMW